ncbi:MAG: AAA family ATPase [Microcystaceae cyanobacterium]
MLKRIYLDNFRCLVNFELKLDSLHLFLGHNGTGKSSVFDVLLKLQSFILDQVRLSDLFSLSDCTSWQISTVQTFELEIEENGELYKYELAINHDFKSTKSRELRTEYEKLSCNGQLLIEFSGGTATIYQNHQPLLANKFPFHGYQSILSLFSFGINNSNNEQKIEQFARIIRKILIIKVIPSLVKDYSEEENLKLSEYADNYASWYRYLAQDQGKVLDLMKMLKELFEDFAYFKFEPMGEFTRLLKVRFERDSQKLEYKLSQLSDGQKVLIILYTLITCLKGENYTLCIDEPDNFLALAEIQPWLIQINDLCDENKLQAFLISHHPEVMNFASSVGYWFERSNHYTPVRVKTLSTKIQEKNLQDPSITLSELIARGWLDD